MIIKLINGLGALVTSHLQPGWKLPGAGNHIARCSRDPILAEVAARCCPSPGITFDTSTSRPKQQNHFAQHHLHKLVSMLGKSALHIFPHLLTRTADTWGSCTPQFPQLLPHQVRGPLPGKRGHPSCSPREGKQNVIFVTILYWNSKSFCSLLTSNVVWAILPAWNSQGTFISPCGWGFLRGGHLFWGQNMWTLGLFPVQATL